MNKQELVDKYGSPEAGARAVATGAESVRPGSMASGDFEAFEIAFQNLILFEQGSLIVQANTAPKIPPGGTNPPAGKK